MAQPQLERPTTQKMTVNEGCHCSEVAGILSQIGEIWWPRGVKRSKTEHLYPAAPLETGPWSKFNFWLRKSTNSPWSRRFHQQAQGQGYFIFWLRKSTISTWNQVSIPRWTLRKGVHGQCPTFDWKNLSWRPAANFISSWIHRVKP